MFKTYDEFRKEVEECRDDSLYLIDNFLKTNAINELNIHFINELKYRIEYYLAHDFEPRKLDLEDYKFIEWNVIYTEPLHLRKSEHYFSDIYNEEFKDYFKTILKSNCMINLYNSINERNKTVKYKNFLRNIMTRRTFLIL
jgi:hypothetical protein